MKLSVLCLNYSTNGYTTAPFYDVALTLLFESTLPQDTEVIMVDNGSTNRDGLEQLKAAWSDKVQFIELPKNLGFHGGYDAAFQKASGDYLLVLNPDIELRPDTISIMLSHLETHKDVGLVAPQLLYPDGVIQDSYRRYMNLMDQAVKRLRFLHVIPYFKNRMHRYLMWNVDPHATQEVDWVVGACMLMPRTAFEEIGGFDNRYFLFMGDTDICRTFWKHGWKVLYLPEAKATHRKSRLSGNNFLDSITKKTFWIHIIDFAKYFLKWGLSSKRPE